MTLTQSLKLIFFAIKTHKRSNDGRLTLVVLERLPVLVNRAWYSNWRCERCGCARIKVGFWLKLFDVLEHSISRLTGAGWGGCTVSLIPGDLEEDFIQKGTVFDSKSIKNTREFDVKHEKSKSHFMKGRTLEMMLFFRPHPTEPLVFSTAMETNFGKGPTVRPYSMVSYGHTCNSMPTFALYNKLYTQTLDLFICS